MKFVNIRDKNGGKRFAVSQKLAGTLISELKGKWVEKVFVKTGKAMVFVFDEDRVINTFAGNGIYREQGDISGTIFVGDYLDQS